MVAGRGIVRRRRPPLVRDGAVRRERGFVRRQEGLDVVEVSPRRGEEEQGRGLAGLLGL